jgi:hypothetical protein
MLCPLYAADRFPLKLNALLVYRFIVTEVNFEMDHKINAAEKPVRLDCRNIYIT